MVETIAEQVSLPHAKAVEVVEVVLSTIERVLSSGQEVRLSGFGAFVTTTRKATKGRHPRTGDAIDIPSSSSVKFRVGSSLKGAISRSIDDPKTQGGG